jgi:hypothetical protein
MFVARAVTVAVLSAFLREAIPATSLERADAGRNQPAVLIKNHVLRERSSTLAQIFNAAPGFDVRTAPIAPGTTLEVQFFPESIHSLQVTGAKPRSAARSTAWGTIDGVEGSYFVMSRNEGNISARFSCGDGRKYLLKATGVELMRVIDIDSSVGSSCGNRTRSLAPEAASPAVASALSAPVNSLAVPLPSDRALPAQLDLLVVYTPSVLAAAGNVSALEGQIDTLIETANLCFSNSLINASVNLAHAQLTASEENGFQLNDLKQLVEPDDGFFDEVHELRDRYRADLVCLLVTDHDHGGVSELIYRASPGYAPFAFFVCNYEQSLMDLTFPHELGHDLGAKHDHANDDASPSPEFPAGYGYVFTANGAQHQTVMVPTSGPEIPYFSNPDVSYMGVATGVPLGQPNPANNAEVLNRTAWIAESYRTASNSLAEGLDTVSIPWRTSAEHPWRFERSVTHDGTDAVQSSDLVMGQSSWIEARLFGPGTLDFWFNLVSTGGDELELSIDGVAQRSFTSSSGWQHPSAALPEGAHLVRWTHRKNSPLVSGEGAWLDQVTTQVAAVILSRETTPEDPIIQTSDYHRDNPESSLRYRIVIEGSAPMAEQWIHNGQPLSGKTNATLTFASLQPAAGGTYQLEIQNAAGTVRPLITELQVPASPPFAWLQTASSSNALGRSIALDSDSNALVCGFFVDSISFGPKTLVAPETNHLQHGYVAKFSASGSLLWAQQISASGGADIASSIRTDATGNAYLSGIFQSNITVGTTTLASAGGLDIYLTKFDPNGKLLWARQAGGPGDDSAGVAVDAAGNVYLPGTFNETAQFGTRSVTSAGGSDAFLAKYSPSGTPLWVVRAGGTNDDFGGAAVVDSSGFIYFVGSVAGTANFQSTQITAPGISDCFIAKYTTGGGQLSWVKYRGQLPGSKSTPSSVTIDVTGDVLVAGDYVPAGFDVVRGFVDIWDPKKGDYLVGQILGAHGRLRARSVRSDEDGSYYVGGAIKDLSLVGPTHLTARGDWDGFVAKFTYDGNAVWIKTFGGTGYDLANAMTVNPQGDVFLTGTYSGDAAFSPFTASGGYNFWLGKVGATTGPNLSAVKSGGSLQLSWAMTAGDMSLESATTLSSTSVWTAVTYDPQPGNTNSLIVPISTKTEFFQLR